MAPNNRKLEKAQHMEFGPLNEKELTAMAILQKRNFFYTVLAFAYAGGHYTLSTDVRNVHVCCVLLQDQPDKATRPIGYWSRLLKRREKGILYQTARVDSNRLVFTPLTFESRRYTAHHSDCQQFAFMDFELSRCNRKTCTEATLSI